MKYVYEMITLCYNFNAGKLNLLTRGEGHDKERNDSHAFSRRTGKPAWSINFQCSKTSSVFWGNTASLIFL